MEDFVHFLHYKLYETDMTIRLSEFLWKMYQ